VPVEAWQRSLSVQREDQRAPRRTGGVRRGGRAVWRRRTIGRRVRVRRDVPPERSPRRL